MESVQVGWFEIPVVEINRAKMFYEAVFNIEIQIMDFGQLKMGMFPVIKATGQSPGALVYHPNAYIPSNSQGILLYLNSDDITKTLERVSVAGGAVIQEVRQVSEAFGSTGVFIDSEGNRIALRSR